MQSLVSNFKNTCFTFSINAKQLINLISVFLSNQFKSKLLPVSLVASFRPKCDVSVTKHKSESKRPVFSDFLLASVNFLFLVNVLSKC